MGRESGTKREQKGTDGASVRGGAWHTSTTAPSGSESGFGRGRGRVRGGAKLGRGAKTATAKQIFGRFFSFFWRA